MGRRGAGPALLLGSFAGSPASSALASAAALLALCIVLLLDSESLICREQWLTEATRMLLLYCCRNGLFHSVGVLRPYTSSYGPKHRPGGGRGRGRRVLVCSPSKVSDCSQFRAHCLACLVFEAVGRRAYLRVGVWVCVSVLCLRLCVPTSAARREDRSTPNK